MKISSSRDDLIRMYMEHEERFRKQRNRDRIVRYGIEYFDIEDSWLCGKPVGGNSRHPIR